jgi:hypothetical protein
MQREIMFLINIFLGINIINELHCLPHHIKMMKLRILNSFMAPCFLHRLGVGKRTANSGQKGDFFSV